MKKQLYKNVISTFAAQIIGVIASICMTGLIPKFTTVLNFSYWQLFVFYSSFIGLLHFGLIDGLYLKFGGRNLTSLPKNEVNSYFLYFLIGQISLGLIGVVLSMFLSDSSERIVLLFTSIYIPIKNIYSFFCFLLLATNEIVHNSKCEIFRKGTLILLIVAIFIGGFSEILYTTIITIYLISEIIPFWGIVKPFNVFIKDFSFLPFKHCVKGLTQLIKEGSFLTISNIISTLILGIGRFFIKTNWSIEVFGIVSLSLSLTFFLISIITQSSQTLFPYIRNEDIAHQKRIYGDLSDMLSLVFSFVFVVYFPLAYIVKLWLPNYAVSVDYLAILCLICLFEGKMGLLCTTYLKCMNRQRTLLLINIITLGISALTTGISAYILHSLDALLYSMVLGLAIRYIIADLYVRRIYEVKFINYALLIDIVLSLLFVFVHSTLNNTLAFLAMSLIVGITLLVRKEIVISTIRLLKVK